jgi:hypothetical protein
MSAYSSRKQAEKLKEKTETMIMEGNQKVEMLQGVNVKMEKAKIHVIEMDIPFAPGAKRFLF